MKKKYKKIIKLLVKRDYQTLQEMSFKKYLKKLGFKKFKEDTSRHDKKFYYKRRSGSPFRILLLKRGFNSNDPNTNRVCCYIYHKSDPGKMLDYGERYDLKTFFKDNYLRTTKEKL